ncbi:uncharacterized protein C2orf78-like [Myotis daubentonii]|uniref:uncharacterized protein C2orf78-like n=1 Tax=Myotis daubentonii TaxID=98922 RepID=UPI002872C6ED|nr:uncharacterized protein C2orf78-like [Myotis daubentonii]
MKCYQYQAGAAQRLALARAPPRSTCCFVHYYIPQAKTSSPISPQGPRINSKNPTFLGISTSLQCSLPVESNAGSVCNFYNVSAPANSSPWLLPSASGTSFQPLMGGAYFYQHSSTTMLSGIPGQSPISIPPVFEWALTGDTGKKSSSLRNFTVTVTDQDTTVSSMSLASQCDQPSDAYNMAPQYPSLSVNLVQGAPIQGQSLSHPYQAGNHVCYYNQGTMDPLLSEEGGPYLQSYGSVSYTESRASAPDPGMVMVLKEAQSTNMIPPASTSGICYSVPPHPITKTGFQVMETSLALQLPGQIFYLPPTQEFLKSGSNRHIQVLESYPPPQSGDISMAPLVQSPRNLLALPPAPSQEQKESKNVENIKTKLSKHVNGYQIPTENEASPLLPLEVPDIPQVLACTDPLGQEEQPGCDNSGWAKNSLSLKDQGTLENGTESNDSFADIDTLVEGIHLPQVFTSLDDVDQPQGPKVIKTKDTRGLKLHEVQKKPSARKTRSDQGRKIKHKASESISDAPKAKIKPESPDCVFVGELVPCNAAAGGRAPSNVAKHSSSKPQKAAASRTSNTKSHGQENTKRNKENYSKRAEERKQSGNKVKAEEKPAIPKMKRKKSHPELPQEAIKKPRSSLGMHMLESVQVFHALGKKRDEKADLSSSRALGNSSSPKGPQSRPATKPWLVMPREGKGPVKTQVNPQKPDASADKGAPPPSQDKLPSPGKVKLVPLVFPTMDKPQVRPIPRRPQSLASRRPAVTNPAKPAAVNASLPNPVSLTGPVKSARPISSNSAGPGLNNCDGPSVPQPPASRPGPYRTSSCASFQREPVHSAVSQPRTPLKPHNHYLLQDFALQPIPWRKSEVRGPVMSTPITSEQRPDREAMKRKAQLERENAAKLGGMQHFIEREKEMDISLSYGYVM